MKSKVFIVGVIILAILVKILSGVRKKRVNSRVHIEIGRVEYRRLERKLVLNYSIKPLRCTEFLIPAGSKLYDFKEKHSYRTGEVIFRLFNLEDSIKMEIAKVEYQQSFEEFRHTQKLYQLGMVGKARYIEDSLAFIKAFLKYKKVKQEANKGVIKAPFSGYIESKEGLYNGRSFAESYQLRYCSNDLTLELQFPQYFLPYVKYLPETLELHLITPFERNIKGMFREVSGSVKGSGEEFYCPVRYLILDRDIFLKPGIEGYLSMSIVRGDSVLSVPSMAITGADTPWVFIVRHNRAYRRRVIIGFIGDDFTEIVSGLNNGDSIIVGPSSALIILQDSDYVSY